MWYDCIIPGLRSKSDPKTLCLCIVNCRLLLFERSEYDDDVVVRKIRVWWWCSWSKGQSAEDDVADRKVKVLKMLLLIERSKMLLIEKVKDVANRSGQSCCWSKWSRCCCCWRLKIEDEDYMMLKSFQWFIDVLPWWCWWCHISLSPIIVVVGVVIEYTSC